MKNKAFNLIQSGKLKEAKLLIKQLTKSMPKDSQCWYLSGLVKAREQKYKEAETDLLRSLKLKIEPQTYLTLGQVFLVTNKLDKAQQYLEKAVSLDETLVDAYNGLATIYSSTGKDSKAIEYYEIIINMNAANEFVYGNIALLYERLRKSEQANKSAKKAISLNPCNMPGNLVLARENRENAEYDQSIDRLKRVLSAGNIHPSAMVNIKSEMGLTLDLKGDYRGAFSAFLSSKEASREIAKQAPYNESYYLKRLVKNKVWFTTERVKQFPVIDIKNNARKPPVFFVGFPRSGTTLVEQILSSNANIETSGEEVVLNDLIVFARKNIKGSKKYPDFLEDYNLESRIVELRDEYFNQLKTVCGFDGDNKMFIDKLPLNLVDLGFINQVFPDAKIIMAYRDPRDVCLSCFMQVFQLNPAMIQFLTLKSTANFYAKTMDLWLHYKEVLNLNVFEYKYEDLVLDSESITKKMVGFLGEEWSADMLEYYKRVAQKNVATPSFVDIKLPIYTRAVQRWKNYTEEIEEIEDILEPYIKEFGYST